MVARGAVRRTAWNRVRPANARSSARIGPRPAEGGDDRFGAVSGLTGCGVHHRLADLHLGAPSGNSRHGRLLLRGPTGNC
ncbi:unnamed protein product [Ciceribacter sp. T2.26MG-112.2]|nr:unnamed protein product [Ciceribacter naphthalenivorans]